MVSHVEQINKILIIKLAAIGDVMFASPLVANLKANFPEAEVHWLGDSWTKEVLEHIPGINKVFFYDRPWLARSKTRAYLQIPFLIKKIRGERYDLAIIPHRSNLAFRLANLTGIPSKIGFANLTNNNLNISVKYDSAKHEIERNLDLLRALDLNIQTNEMIFALDDSLINKVKSNYLKEADYRICIAPGGGVNPGLNMPLKRWPMDRYRGLAQRLEELGCQIVLIGTENDKGICNFISESTKAINLCSQTTLIQTAAVIKNCNLFIGNDSGPLYIAAALGVQTLGIYGATDPQLLAPLGGKLGDSPPKEDCPRHAYIVNKTDCSPCYHPSSTVQGEYKQCQYDQKCLNDLSIEQVYKKTLEIATALQDKASQ